MKVFYNRYFLIFSAFLIFTVFTFRELFTKLNDRTVYSSEGVECLGSGTVDFVREKNKSASVSLKSDVIGILLDDGSRHSFYFDRFAVERVPKSGEPCEIEVDSRGNKFIKIGDNEDAISILIGDNFEASDDEDVDPFFK